MLPPFIADTFHLPDPKPEPAPASPTPIQVVDEITELPPVARMLIAGRDYLRQHGWIKKKLWSAENEKEKPPCCIVGACIMAAGERTRIMLYGVGWTDWWQKRMKGVPRPDNFNDHFSTQFDDVERWFAKQITDAIARGD